jgi:hypothetical protein
MTLARSRQSRQQKRTTTVAKDIFERLDKGRPPIEEGAKRPQKIQHAQRLLDWLQHWTEPTIRARDIRIYGPRPRDRESAIDSAKILVEHGWLVPNKTRRYDSQEWQIVRKLQAARPVAELLSQATLATVG